MCFSMPSVRLAISVCWNAQHLVGTWMYRKHSCLSCKVGWVHMLLKWCQPCNYQSQQQGTLLSIKTTLQVLLHTNDWTYCESEWLTFEPHIQLAVYELVALQDFSQASPFVLWFTRIRWGTERQVVVVIRFLWIVVRSNFVYPQSDCFAIFVLQGQGLCFGYYGTRLEDVIPTELTGCHWQAKLRTL